jgi:hypothetical protein
MTHKVRLVRVERKRGVQRLRLREGAVILLP